MALRSRLFALLVVSMLMASASGIALAQTDGPDPDSPIQLPTAESEETPQNGEGDPTEEAEPTATSVQPTETATAEPDEPEATPVASDGSPTAEASPVAGDASPVASAPVADLAAMALESSSIPDEFTLIGEGYTTIDELADTLIGQIEREELVATGMVAYYQSYYINEAGNALRTYIISYQTVEGVQAGFDLLEDEERLVPNGALTDLPGLTDVGEEPAEITTGTIENGDGTQTATYDVTFRIDRYHLGAAMETADGSEPFTDVVDAMAVDLAERVTAVLAGTKVQGVVYGLPDQLIELDVPATFEGYQSVDESFLIEDPASLPRGYLGGYYRGASYSGSISTILPYVTIGVNQFASPEGVELVLARPEVMMPSFPDLAEIAGMEIDGVDAAVLAFSFSSPDGNGTTDSVRLFIQIGEQLISIDVQGLASLEEATAVAVNLAELQVACTIDGDCTTPGSIDPATQD